MVAFRPSVFQLGFVELGTNQLDAIRAYYMDVLGLQETERTSDAAYFSCALFQHEIATRVGPTGLRAFGLQLTPELALGDAERTLRDVGVASERRTDARPGIRELLQFSDPGGNTVQLYSMMDMPGLQFSGRGIGARRLGHIALMSDNAERMVKFYTEVFGFVATDWFEDVATFITCNKDHHVLNIINGPIGKLHHVAFELNDAASLCRAADVLRREKHPIRWGPARHTAGHNIASYHYDPDHTLVELYAELDVFIPELGICEPRPWHEAAPQRPRRWSLSELSAWGPDYAFNLATA